MLSSKNTFPFNWLFSARLLFKKATNPSFVRTVLYLDSIEDIVKTVALLILLFSYSCCNCWMFGIQNIADLKNNTISGFALTSLDSSKEKERMSRRPRATCRRLWRATTNRNSVFSVDRLTNWPTMNCPRSKTSEPLLVGKKTKTKI